MALSSISLSIWPLLAAAVFVYVVVVCIYRRTRHPLAKIPGPFLPAVTMLYQSFYNRHYYLEIERMHRKYGLSTERIARSLFIAHKLQGLLSA